MLKFTSVSGSVRGITADITLTVTIIRTAIIDLIIDRITVLIGTAGTVITATIIDIPIITGTSLTGIATPGWLEISSQPIFLRGIRRRGPPSQARAPIFLTSVKPPA